MNKKKKLVKILLIFALAVFVCGCSKSTDEKVETQKEQKADFSEKEKSKEADTETKEDSIEESIVSEENIDAYQNSSSENDTDLGLKNMKVDYAQGELSEEQKQIIEYFSRDYMFVNSGEALQRYNNIFDHALIRCYVNVIKVISYEGNDYELLVSIMENSNETDDQLLNESRYMIIKGATQESRFIQGDFLLIEGRYNGVVQETVDGISLTVPEIAVHGGYVLQEDDGWYFYPSRFSMLEVKNIAKSVFGLNPEKNRNAYECAKTLY